MSLDLEQYRVPNMAECAYYVRDFISESEEATLVSRALGAPLGKWTALRGRRAAQWGGVPPLRREPLPAWLAALPARLEAAGLPRPDHALVNEYAPGQGILPHEDGPRFLPAVATVSCGGPAVLRLWARAPPPDGHALRPAGGLLLEPRSLVVLRGQLYTAHAHSIDPCEHDTLDDSLRNLSLVAPAVAALPPLTVLPRAHRISFTLRRVARANQRLRQPQSDTRN